jgi:hypothetical protein
MKRSTALIFASLATIFCTQQGASRDRTNASTQATTPATGAADLLKVPEETAFLAKLTSSLISSRSKPDDPVEAQTTQDVKRGKEVLLKKGSSLLGHVKLVEVSQSEKPETLVGIVFDGVKMQKTGQQLTLHLIIQALAPDSDLDSNNSLADATGTGLTSATRAASVSGHSSTTRGSVNGLTKESTGVYEFAGVRLGDRVTTAGHVTILAFSNADALLKKGTQLVMRVVNQ